MKMPAIHHVDLRSSKVVLESATGIGKIAAMLTSRRRQNNFASALCAIVISLGLSGCGSTSNSANAVLHGEKQTFTGKIVLAGDGYRLRLNDSDDSLRLTRAKRATEFAHEEIDLRKYYEKTLAVRGTRQNEWIWDAEIVGQWNKPGESTGPNLLAPPSGHR